MCIRDSLSRHEIFNAIKEWYRVLEKKGRLVIECPDFDEDVKEYLAGNEKRLDNIFGLQRFPGDLHKFGYNYPRLKTILEFSGFGNCEQKPPQDYHINTEPCIRVECLKL